MYVSEAEVEQSPTEEPERDTKDTDGDGMPDMWEKLHFLDPYSSEGIDGADGDPDEDGVSNLDEYLRGTDPFKNDG